MLLLVLDFVFVFCLGAAVGSFVNVCASRLPYEKSLLWPGSRCGSCFQPVQLRDNIPLVSYWVLRGRCRHCGAPFALRYFLVELFTAVGFVAVFFLTLYYPPLQSPFLRSSGQVWALSIGWVPWQGWVMFAHHATLFTFLLITSLCDLEHMEIPLPITVTGTALGLVLAALLAWPFPDGPAVIPRPVESAFAVPGEDTALTLPSIPRLPLEQYRCPVWFPLPAWLPPGSWQLGLATGLAGAVAGMALMRGIRFLFGVGRGIEGLGIGDADLMMMAGAFVGWQVVVLALFVAVFPALLLAVVQLVRRGEQTMPFGPPLALGVLVTQFAWPWLGQRFEVLFFDPFLVGFLTVGGAIILFVTSLLLRLLRGGAETA